MAEATGGRRLLNATAVMASGTMVSRILGLVRNMLLALGREEVYASLKEHGAIVIHDELSNHEYRFTKLAIDELFSRTPETPKTVH